MRTRRIFITAVVLASLTLAGCSDTAQPATDESAGPAATDSADQPTESPEPETEQSSPEPENTIVEITISGHDVEPSGARVEAQVGEPVTLQITSDRAGELHVHSTPEQEIPFSKGTSEAELTIDQPGVVEVEDHHSGLVIVQLEVR
jgi:predicted small secreted protein